MTPDHPRAASRACPDARAQAVHGNSARVTSPAATSAPRWSRPHPAESHRHSTCARWPSHPLLAIVPSVLTVDTLVARPQAPAKRPAPDAMVPSSAPLHEAHTRLRALLCTRHCADDRCEPSSVAGHTPSSASRRSLTGHLSFSSHGWARESVCRLLVS